MQGTEVNSKLPSALLVSIWCSYLLHRVSFLAFILYDVICELDYMEWNGRVTGFYLIEQNWEGRGNIEAIT